MVKRSAYAIIIYLIISLPFIFFTVSYKNESDHISFLAELNAGKISNYVIINGSLWEYHGYRLTELVEFHKNTHNLIDQSVRTSKDKLVFGINEPLSWFEIEKSAPIFLYETKVGSLFVRKSFLPLLNNTAIIVFIASLFAMVVHILIRRGPLRFISHTMARLNQEQIKRTLALENLRKAERVLAKRSEQLIEAQIIGKIGDWTMNVGEETFILSPVTRKMLFLDENGIEPNLVNLRNRMSEKDSQMLIDMISQAIRTHVPTSIDVDFRAGDDTIIRLSINCTAARDRLGNAQKLTGTIQDISERREAEKQLEKLAYFDSLTGLANRTMFKREIAHITDCLGGSDMMTGAILLLDLDHFKEVNDTLGHTVGDQLLCKVAQRISNAMQGRHFCSRLGGDEFALIIQDGGNPDIIYAYAQKLLDVISETYMISGNEVSIGTSIGIAAFPEDGTNGNALITHADLALYRAKGLGREQFVKFTPDMSEIAIRKMALAHDLREATQQGKDLEVWLQPQVDIKKNKIIGFEALMRWQHSEFGFIPPSEFIPIAESSSLICDIGNWILCESVRTAKRWIDEGQEPYEIAVNVSPAQIWQGNIEEEVAAILKETELPPHLLCIELTESLFVDHAEETVKETLTRLKLLGVTLALDDFGTGYSSMGYLIQLPFDKLKVDRIFIKDVHKSKKMKHVLKGIVALGKGLGMTIVAEGVEKIEELAILKELECDLVQGYLFAKPAPSDTIVQTTKKSISLIQKAA